jgi:ADP-ribosyl-[dinitrogen reductase] hydrolase
MLNSIKPPPLIIQKIPDLHQFSIFNTVDQSIQDQVLAIPNNVHLDRAEGAFLGMPIADSLGARLEFMDASEKPPNLFEYNQASGGKFDDNVENRFGLELGQWSDDASMGLCLADSILTQKGYNGSNLRLWFWNWWYNGLNNAHRLEPRKDKKFPDRRERFDSCGLGTNISKSLDDMTRNNRTTTPDKRFVDVTEDAGNGSLMRLAAVPIFFSKDPIIAANMGAEQSYTTHPGKLAADACAFMSYFIASAINRTDETPIKEFIDTTIFAFLTIFEPHFSSDCIDLLQSVAPTEKEACWNWKAEPLLIDATLYARLKDGDKYNGYVTSRGYFGAFSLDGLAMALHAVYTTVSFDAAITKVINFAGDADTTGSICGQIAGAFYGKSSINKKWIENLHRYAGKEFELRARALFLLSSRGP